MNKFRKPHGKPEGREFGSRDPRRPHFGKPMHGGLREERQLFDATCSNCGNACRVPFRPNGTKPVYCSNCFNSPRQGQEGFVRRDAAPVRTFEARAEDPGIVDLKRQVNAMNIKIDTMLKILETHVRTAAPAEIVTTPKISAKEIVHKIPAKKKLLKKK